MRKIKLTILAQLLCLCLLLSSCMLPPPSESGGGGEAEFSPAESADLIIEAMEQTLREGGLGYPYASDYLAKWGMPEFDAAKLKWVESVFLARYNYEGGISNSKSAVLKRAADICTKFIEKCYDEIDLDSKDEVTLELIDLFVECTNDPYAVYRLPDEYDEFDTDMSGKFYGIGMMVEYDHKNETIMVSAVYSNSPAERAGLRVGDFIYAIDGVAVSEIGYLNAVYHIRGEKDVPVTVTVLRGERKIDLTAIRDEIIEKSVIFEITEDNIGYIQITTFKSNTDDQFAEALDELSKAGVSGIVFDLRNNTGGYLETVANMLSLMLPMGKTVVSYDLKSVGRRYLTTQADGYSSDGSLIDLVLNLPMVVLCNEYTASAAEIFTSVVRDYRNEGLFKAKIVGTTTYKKGIMQSTHTHTDGSSITLTIAYYNPPCGVNYHGIGIEPDITVENTEDADLQYERAIAELKNLINEN